MRSTQHTAGPPGILLPDDGTTPVRVRARKEAMPATKKQRLDLALVARGLASSREQARARILAGEVTVDGQVVVKPGALVAPTATLGVRQPPAYVSRGGYKLAHALDVFDIDVRGRVCLDAGASTGGFTDCLLQRGARRVYAVDVGYGQLDWRLRQDPRVIVMERVNLRTLTSLPEPIDLATLDLSFISLRLVLQPVRALLRPAGEIVALVKPQFEAGRERVGRGGVIRDPAVHRQVLTDLLEWAVAHGFTVRGLTASPLRGPAGNVEFLAHLTAESGGTTAAIEPLVTAALAQAASVAARA